MLMYICPTFSNPQSLPRPFITNRISLQTTAQVGEPFDTPCWSVYIRVDFRSTPNGSFSGFVSRIYIRGEHLIEGHSIQYYHPNHDGCIGELRLARLSQVW
jgi:hypothetical protein